MNKEEIKRQLKLSKQQNKNERYDYLCSQFNCVNYAIKLEKYTNKLQQENQKYKEVIDKAIEYINHFSKESEVKIYGLPKCKVFIGDIEQLLEILKEVSE